MLQNSKGYLNGKTQTDIVILKRDVEFTSGYLGRGVVDKSVTVKAGTPVTHYIHYTGAGTYICLEVEVDGMVYHWTKKMNLVQVK